MRKKGPHMGLLLVFIITKLTQPISLILFLSGYSTYGDFVPIGMILVWNTVALCVYVWAAVFWGVRLRINITGVRAWKWIRHRSRECLPALPRMVTHRCTPTHPNHVFKGGQGILELEDSGDSLELRFWLQYTLCLLVSCCIREQTKQINNNKTEIPTETWELALDYQRSKLALKSSSFDIPSPPISSAEYPACPIWNQL